MCVSVHLLEVGLSCGTAGVLLMRLNAFMMIVVTKVMEAFSGEEAKVVVLNMELALVFLVMVLVREVRHSGLLVKDD